MITLTKFKEIKAKKMLEDVINPKDIKIKYGKTKVNRITFKMPKDAIQFVEDQVQSAIVAAKLLNYTVEFGDNEKSASIFSRSIIIPLYFKQNGETKFTLSFHIKTKKLDDIMVRVGDESKRNYAEGFNHGYGTYIVIDFLKMRL